MQDADGGTVVHAADDAGPADLSVHLLHQLRRRLLRLHCHQQNVPKEHRQVPQEGVTAVVFVAVACLLACLLANLLASRPSYTLVYLRDGSAQTIARAATLR